MFRSNWEEKYLEYHKIKSYKKFEIGKAYRAFLEVI